jgi:hypothetical protein
LTPLHDEWLPGLLLRYDEVNYWSSRTTLSHVLVSGPEKFHRCWRNDAPNLIVIQPSSLNLDYLAQCLALATSVILHTTYDLELMCLYDITRLHSKLLNTSLTFHICPLCLAQTRLLTRAQVLPHLTLCQQHHLILLERCTCGTQLQLFHRQTQPFTCYACGMDWAELPQVEASLAQVEQDQKYLTWYEFFFSKGTPAIRRAAQYMMIGFSREHLPLGRLLTLLIQSGQFPQDVLNWMDRASPLQKKFDMCNNLSAK